MDVKLQVNRLLIAADAILRSLVNKKNDGKRVLIVFQQIFGDAIVISDSLNEYLQIFPKEQGYEITFIARPSVIAFMRETVAINDDIKIEPVDFKRFVDDYKYYKSVIKKYKKYATVIIVPGTSLSAEIFACGCNADRKIGLVRSIPITKPLINKIFYNRAYTETVVPDKEDMMLQRHRLLLNYLGDNEYRAGLPRLIEKDRVIDGAYVVCCPGSSKMEKCWPVERFVAVIDHINEKYGLPVHLCGGDNEIEFEEKVRTFSSHPELIISHIGKTGFSDWSAIVQHAELVIGNDSATMHLAAASRRKAICIAGGYDKYQFFPYQVDELKEGDRLPVTIIKDMPCEWCRTIGYDAGYGNAECKKRIEQNLCSICIEQVTVEEVIRAVDDLMNDFGG